MKSKERRLLEEQLTAAVTKVLAANNAALTVKIEKLLRKQ
jgi:hypothetical protein